MKFVTLCLVFVVAAFDAVGVAAQDKAKLLGHMDRCWASAGHSGTHHHT